MALKGRKITNRYDPEVNKLAEMSAKYVVDPRNIPRSPEKPDVRRFSKDLISEYDNRFRAISSRFPSESHPMYYDTYLEHIDYMKASDVPDTLTVMFMDYDATKKALEKCQATKRASPRPRP